MTGPGRQEGRPQPWKALHGDIIHQRKYKEGKLCDVTQNDLKLLNLTVGNFFSFSVYCPKTLGISLSTEGNELSLCSKNRSDYIFIFKLYYSYLFERFRSGKKPKKTENLTNKNIKHKTNIHTLYRKLCTIFTISSLKLIRLVPDFNHQMRHTWFYKMSSYKCYWWSFNVEIINYNWLRWLVCFVEVRTRFHKPQIIFGFFL